MTEKFEAHTGGGRKAGSLADMVTAAKAAPSFAQSFPRITLLKVFMLAGLLGWLNWWQFPGLVNIWRSDANWSHCFLIPLFSLYLLYVRREEIFSTPRRVCLWGLPIVILGLAMIPLGHSWIRTIYVCNVSMILVVLGSCCTWGGRA